MRPYLSVFLFCCFVSGYAVNRASEQQTKLFGVVSIPQQEILIEGVNLVRLITAQPTRKLNNYYFVWTADPGEVRNPGLEPNPDLVGQAYKQHTLCNALRPLNTWYIRTYLALSAFSIGIATQFSKNSHTDHVLQAFLALQLAHAIAYYRFVRSAQRRNMDITVRWANQLAPNNQQRAQVREISFALGPHLGIFFFATQSASREVYDRSPLEFTCKRNASSKIILPYAREDLDPKNQKSVAQVKHALRHLCAAPYRAWHLGLGFGFQLLLYHGLVYRNT